MCDAWGRNAKKAGTRWFVVVVWMMSLSLMMILSYFQAENIDLNLSLIYSLFELCYLLN